MGIVIIRTSAHHVDTVVVIVADTEVLLEVDSVLRDPEGVSHVGAHQLHALETLGAREPDTETCIYRPSCGNQLT